MNYLKAELYKLIKQEDTIFDFLQESALDGMWYWDLTNFEDEWMNSRFWEVLGYDPSEMPHKASAWQDMIFPEDKELALQQVQAHFADPNVPYDQVVRYWHKEGHIVWIRCRGLAIRDKEGNPVRMLGAHQDVTELYQEKEKIRNQLATYQALLDNQSSYLLKIALDGTYTFINDYYCEDLSWDKEFLIGKPSTIGIVEESIQHSIDLGNRAFNNPGQRIIGELSKIDGKGNLRVSKWEFLALFDDEGAAQELLCIGHDITEEKRAQASLDKSYYKLKENHHKLKSVLQASGISLWKMDSQSLQIEFEEELIYQQPVKASLYQSVKSFDTWVEMIHTDDRERVKEAFQQFIAQKGSQDFDIEYRIVVEVGQGSEVYYFKSSATYWVDEEEEYVIGTMQDITSSKVKERTISYMQNILEQAGEVARIGAWDYNVMTNQNTWSKTTKDIHEVPEDFTPDPEQGINFYKEGESRERIARVFTRCIEEGVPFDEEFELITHKGKEIWVRSIGVAQMENGKCERVYGTFQDITEQVEARSIIQQEKEFSNQLLDNMAEGLSVIDANGKQVRVNKAFCDMTGFSQEELLGGNAPYIYWPEEEYDTINKAFQETIRGQQKTFELVFKRKSGERFPVSISTSMVKNEHGEVTYYFANIMDIRERKESEQALSLAFSELTEKNHEINSLLEGTGIGIWKMDLSTQEFYLDSYGVKLMEGEGVDPTYDYWTNLLHPADREAANQAFQNFLEGGEKYDMQYRITLPSGQERIHRSQGTKFRNVKGEAIKVIGILQDVTEKVTADQEIAYMQDVMEQAGRVAKIGAWEYHIESERNTWTKVVHQIYELPLDKILPVNEGINFFKEGYSRNRIAEAVDKCIKEHIPYDEELELITATGKEVWVRAIGLPEVVDGTCKRIYGIIQDISQQRKEKQALEEAKVRAEEASVAKSNFLANMSHEIRTPLNSVIGFSELLTKTNVDDTQRDYLNYVNNSAKSLLDLINDILDFSKIEAGKLELSEGKVDIWELGNQIIDIVRYKTEEKGLVLTLDISLETPQYVYADAVRLKQVVINLIGNAVKFTESGSIKLGIESKPTETAGILEYVFSVEDSGIGIPQDKQQKIFEAFSQEDASITRKFGGTGLGLSISNSLLQMMDSQLELESQEGEGSCFFFKLQLRAEEEVIIESEESKELLAQIQQVLIIDDSMVNGKVLKELLQKRNIPCAVVDNGMKALQFLSSNNQVDVIITDYQMPFMNGIEVIDKARRELKLSAAEVKVMLFHGLSNDDHIMKKAVEVGIEQVIKKPITAAKLYKSLTDLRSGNAQTEKMEANKSITDNPKPNMSTGQFQILVVDDNPINRVLARSIVSNIIPNVEVIEASNGTEAEELFFTHKPDLVLMDIQMPGISGYEATKIIRQRETGNRVPIIALTARALKGEKERCVAVGMDDYLSKPLSSEHLKVMLDTWLPVSEDATNPNPAEASATAGLEHFNREALLQRLGFKLGDGNEQVVEEILELVRQGALKRVIAKARELVMFRAAADSIQSMAHTIKGAAMGSGFEIMASLAEQIEKMSPFNLAKASELLDAIEKEEETIMKLIG